MTLDTLIETLNDYLLLYGDLDVCGLAMLEGKGHEESTPSHVLLTEGHVWSQSLTPLQEVLASCRAWREAHGDLPVNGEVMLWTSYSNPPKYFVELSQEFTRQRRERA